MEMPYRILSFPPPIWIPHPESRLENRRTGGACDDMNWPTPHPETRDGGEARADPTTKNGRNAPVARQRVGPDRPRALV